MIRSAIASSDGRPSCDCRRREAASRPDLTSSALERGVGLGDTEDDDNHVVFAVATA